MTNQKDKLDFSNPLVGTCRVTSRLSRWFDLFFRTWMMQPCWKIQISEDPEAGQKAGTSGGRSMLSGSEPLPTTAAE